MSKKLHKTESERHLTEIRNAKAIEALKNSYTKEIFPTERFTLESKHDSDIRLTLQTPHRHRNITIAKLFYQEEGTTWMIAMGLLFGKELYMSIWKKNIDKKVYVGANPIMRREEKKEERFGSILVPSLREFVEWAGDSEYLNNLLNSSGRNFFIHIFCLLMSYDENTNVFDVENHWFMSRFANK